MEEFEEAVKYVNENIEGVSFVGIVGRDGLPISVLDKGDMDSAEASAELASIFNGIVKSIKALEVGMLTELFLTTETLGIVVYPVNEEYFLAVAMHTPVNFGRVRLEVKKVLPAIKELIK
ncbi:MAG: roadblock/LC7 domain-containing protein [Caldisericaceae bacterium]